MTRADFVARIFSTLCDRCPIRTYCEITQRYNVGCVQTAERFYNTVTKRGSKEDLIKWLESERL